MVKLLVDVGQRSKFEVGQCVVVTREWVRDPRLPRVGDTATIMSFSPQGYAYLRWDKPFRYSANDGFDLIPWFAPGEGPW